MTAKELALYFDVSIRTIFRDIDQLSSAGIPIYTVQGKGGGIFISNNFVLNKTTISSEEQDQILFALQMMRAADNTATDEIISRLKTLFDKTDQEWIEVDFSRWGVGTSDKERFELLKKAILEERQISFTYMSSYGQTTKRSVYPLKLLFKSKSWYLQAYDLAKYEYRTFKITRISAIFILDNSFSGKQYQIPTAMSSDYSDSFIKLVMTFDSQVAYRVYDEFKSDDIYINVDGTFRVNISLPEDEWLYGFLLSFGNSVRVLEPDSVKENLLNRARQIINFYSH